MKLFQELLLEVTSDFVDIFKSIYEYLPEKRATATKTALEQLQTAVKEDKIFNVEYGEIKDVLSRALENSLEIHYNKISRTPEDFENSPHLLAYKGDISYHGYMNQASAQVKKIKSFLAANKNFPAADRETLEKMSVINEAAVNIYKILSDLKPKVIKGRRPNTNVDPNAFHSKLGSAEAQKIVKEKLEAGVQKPLDDYEKAVKDWLQSIIDDIGDTYTQPNDRRLRDPMQDMIFYQCFESEKDYEKTDKEKTVFKNVKIRNKDFAAKEAKTQRDNIEQKYLTKNIKKLSHVVDLKGNLTEISELPYRKPSIKGGGGTIESGFLFEFADSSEFKVINKIVTKYSASGTQFEQFPTTFHDVKFPDGAKLKSPSEEKMVKEFGGWKLK